MLSRQRISVPQLPQEEGGRKSERRAGTRTATTLRKLPSASAGARTRAVAATLIPYWPVDSSKAEAVRAQTCERSDASRTTTVTSFTARAPAIVCQVTYVSTR
jgi:hypothetical protein